jgi:hypothetical protein
MNIRAKSLRPARSKGAALLVLLLAVVFVFGSVLLASLAGTHPEVLRRQRTLAALAQAKQALIAWSVMQGDLGADSHHRPGTLPCPDRNFFGDASSGYASGSCSSGGGTSLGRFPWRSLDVENLQDAHGETLWYAVSDNFRNPNLYARAINSDTLADLLLYAADGTRLTPDGEEMAAVVFAPGAPLPGQERPIPPDNTASNYLEAFDGKNNASASGPFLMGPVQDANGAIAINDLVIGIRARELVAALEKRALQEAQGALEAHFAAHGRYPNPARPDSSECLSDIANVKSPPSARCASEANTCFGRLPEDALAPYLAPWFLQNAWGRVMIYAIADSAACANSLNVEGNPKRYVLIAPGSAREGQRRPSGLLSDYLEDPGNADGWANDPDFFIPGANSNDQLRAK